MAGHSFEYHPEAVEEAAEAYLWYADRSDEAAEQFLSELRSARQAATDHPQRQAAYLHGTRSCRLRRFPYGLVYVERGNIIFGIAVAHLRRRPGYWRNRLKFQ